jgi:hypothetical protein
MTNSAAYRAGEFFGAAMMIVILLGSLVFFIIALIQAIRTRRTGWIVGACISGLPILALLALFFIGIVVGIMGARNRMAGGLGTTTTTADLLVGNMSPASGTVLPYQISYPSMQSWIKHAKGGSDYDQLYNCGDVYVGVIAENIGLGTPQRVCNAAQRTLTKHAPQRTFTTPLPITIDSHSWLTYDAAATIDGTNIDYRFYVYADSDHTFQIICWTAPGNFASTVPVFDRVAESFKLPK